MEDENKQPAMIPLIVHEMSETRSDARHKTLIKVIVFLIACLLASNMAWLYVYQSYDYTGTETVTVDGDDGNASYIGRDGDVNNGVDKSGQDKAEN